VGVNVLLACVVAHYAVGSRIERLRWVGPAVAAVALVAALIPNTTPYPWKPLGGLEARVIFQEEGELATVQVGQAVDYPAFRGMSIDGTMIGVTRGWHFSVYSKQVLLAHLPMWLEPRTRNVLQIGLGSASTLETLTRYPSLERIDAVEINAAVVRGAEFFDESRALSDPRVTVHVEDAIHYLLSTETNYDLIIADGKQNSDFSGNGKMLSLELYQLARDQLSENGLFVQWIGTTSLPENYEVIARTAASAFPYLNVFYEIPSSTILVGSMKPLLGRSHMTREHVPERALESLRGIGLDQLDFLGFAWMADRDAMLETIGPGLINSWSNSIIDFAAYRATAADRSTSQTAENLRLLLKARKFALERGQPSFVAADPNTREAHRLIRVAFVQRSLNNRQGAITILDRALALAPGDPLVFRARERALRP